ncbi:alpha/beta fold hydrolase [Nocardiopsis coralliicola]
MTAPHMTAVLVPGAWMGAWIWEPTAERLTARGIRAEAVTLDGLAAGTAPADAAAVRLEDHVGQLLAHVGRAAGPVVLVAHSYSSTVAGQVADRAGGKVAGLVHFGGFLPADGRCLLDDWGASAEDRAQEQADIAAAGTLWLPPQRAMLAGEPGLSEQDLDVLADGFTSHPGRTVTDPARMGAPVAAQPATYVALSPEGEEAAWRSAPAAARGAAAWRKRHIASGHWPMLSAPEEVADLVAEEAGHYAGRAAQQPS